MKQAHRFTILAGLLLLAAGLHASDWPQWRGPDRTDISPETGLLKTWPQGGPKLVWLAKDLGMGYAGPAIVRGRLFITGTPIDGENQGKPKGSGMSWAYAYDANTGKRLWKSRLGNALRDRRWAEGPRGTPTVDGNRLYCLTGTGVLACLNAADGKIVWKRTMKEFKGSVGGWKYAESPLVDGNKLIVTPGGKEGAMIALDKTTGRQIWRCKEWKDKAEYSSAIVAEHAGVRQYIQRSKQQVVGVRARDGELLWKIGFNGRTAVIPTPIFHDGHVFVAAGYGKGSKLIRLDGNNKASDAYPQKDNMVNHHGGVIFLDGHLYGYCDNNGWTCMEFKTGKIVWKTKKEKGRKVKSMQLDKGAITYADGRFYLLSENSGTVVLIDASPDGWKERGRFTLKPQTKRRPKGKVWTHPVVSNGKLYLRDQELLFCYDIKSR